MRRLRSMRVSTTIEQTGLTPVDSPPASRAGQSEPLDFGPLRNTVGYVLRRAQLAVFQDFYTAFDALKLRPAHYAALTLIERNPGVNQSQLAEALAIRKASFVTTVAMLEARGLAKRVVPDGDRRHYALFLTEEGAQLMPQLHSVAAAHDLRVTSRLNNLQRKRLIDGLRAFTHASER
jgi:DNA-binding MarR family transcriptional regulator